jgi:hypothetical protein
VLGSLAVPLIVRDEAQEAELAEEIEEGVGERCPC